MAFTIRRYPLPLFVCLAILLVLVEWLVIHSSPFSRGANRLSLGVTVDLVVLLPLLYYWLVVRTGRWSKTSVVAVFGGGVGLAKWLLPVAQHTYVDSVAYVVPVLETGVSLYLVWHGVSLVRNYRQHQQTQFDFSQSLYLSLRDVTGNARLSHIITSEAAVVRYSLLGWLPEKPALTATRTTFTSHRDSGQIAILVMVMVVAGIESVAVHFLLARWSVTAAWLLTATSLYTLLFLIAETVTTVKRPSFQQGAVLHLRFGLRWTGTIARTNIKQIERITEKPAADKQTLTGPLLVQPNLLVTLHEPVVFDGLYGLRKTASRVALLVDSPDRLLTAIQP